MIYTYRLISLILYPLLVLIIYLRKIFNKEDRVRFKEKLFYSSFLNNFSHSKKLIWFHAASIGEVQSIIPIINRIDKKTNKYNFLITTITLSSGKFIKEEFRSKDNITHRYLPLDINFLIKKFILVWNPHAVFFVDSEIWPNLILNLKDKKIPISVINGRLTKKSFKRWKILSSLAYKIFSKFDLILTSNLESKNYFAELGGKNILHLGNIKFSNKIDFTTSKNINEKNLSLKNVWCAVSTHNNEEHFCVKTHIKLKEKISNVLTIIIPRHIERSDQIRKICLNYKLKTQVIRKGETILNETEIVIINSFGVLPEYLKYAKSALIGKSLLPKLKNDGGQNPILAAQMGCRIYHGPYVSNFIDIYKFLMDKNLSEEILTINDLSNNLINDFKIKKDLNQSKELFDNIGERILEKTLKEIENFLNYENL